MSRHQLGPSNVEFSCGPYIRQSTIAGITPPDNLITPDRIFDLLDDTIEYRADAVREGHLAMRGLTTLLLRRSTTRATLLEGSVVHWNTEPRVKLRRAIYALVGSTPDNPHFVRNDSENELDTQGTVIVKGQGGPRTPLFLLERTDTQGVRILDVLDGRDENLTAVTAEANAFSQPERRAATAYIGRRTIDPLAVNRILAHANRYTTPDPDALHGAVLYETRGAGALAAWPDQMSVYIQRKSQLPM